MDLEVVGVGRHGSGIRPPRQGRPAACIFRRNTSPSFEEIYSSSLYRLFALRLPTSPASPPTITTTEKPNSETILVME